MCTRKGAVHQKGGLFYIPLLLNNSFPGVARRIIIYGHKDKTEGHTTKQTNKQTTRLSTL